MNDKFLECLNRYLEDTKKELKEASASPNSFAHGYEQGYLNALLDMQQEYKELKEVV